jgi:TfoX/Sxy family transcriptional regulator of competence genes
MDRSQEAHDRFQTVIETYANAPDVSIGKMFGSTGLQANGKIFAMLVKGKLVVKLPKTRVDELVAMGHGSPFDPGHGRLMKEWVSVEVTGDETEWTTLVELAKVFVSNVPSEK